jgi:acyl carrier protein
MTMNDRETVEILVAAWRDVLQAGEFGPDDNFFDLGGTSNDAIDVIDRLNRELDVDISQIGLFERPTLRAMTELLRAAPGAQPGRLLDESRQRGEQRRAIVAAQSRPSTT